MPLCQPPSGTKRRMPSGRQPGCLCTRQNLLKLWASGGLVILLSEAVGPANGFTWSSNIIQQARIQYIIKLVVNAARVRVSFSFSSGCILDNIIPKKVQLLVDELVKVFIHEPVTGFNNVSGTFNNLLLTESWHTRGVLLHQ